VSLCGCEGMRLRASTDRFSHGDLPIWSCPGLGVQFVWTLIAALQELRSAMSPPRRQKKKKVVEELSDDSDHGDFDAQQVRDHEEWTKVIEGLRVVGWGLVYSGRLEC